MADREAIEVGGKRYEVTSNGWKPLDPPDVLTPVSTHSRWIFASDVKPQHVEWLWTDRVPLGMVTVFGGFPGVGKSTILYDLAARTSREGRTVIVVTAEDHLAAVVRPRLEAAGAHLDKVVLYTGEVTLPESVSELESLIGEHAAAMLMLDPLVAFIGDQVNTHRDHHVRRVLAPLGDMAEKTAAAVVVVIHTNKGTDSNPLMRISGSVGFTGAARSVVVAAEDPNDDTRRILAVAKSNLAKMPPPLAYRLVGVDLVVDDDQVTTSRVEWLGEAPEVDVRDLLAIPKERRGDAARKFLIEAGVQTTARLARDLETEAEAKGINYRTLRRAREDLGVPAWKVGFNPAVWWWGPEGDNAKGTRYTEILSPSAPPAETSPNPPKGTSPLWPGGGRCRRTSRRSTTSSSPTRKRAFREGGDDA